MFKSYHSFLKTQKSLFFLSSTNSRKFTSFSLRMFNFHFHMHTQFRTIPHLIFFIWLLDNCFEHHKWAPCQLKTLFINACKLFLAFFLFLLVNATLTLLNSIEIECLKHVIGYEPDRGHSILTSIAFWNHLTLKF